MQIETSVDSVYLHPDQLDYEYTAPGEGNRVAVYFTDVDTHTFNKIWLSKDEARTLRDQLSEHIKESE